MKVTLFSVAVVVLVVAVGYRHAKATAKKTDADIREVAGILERATANAPPLPAAPPSGPWIEHVKAQCAWRERALARLRRPTTVTGMAAHSRRVLDIHRRFARRVSRRQPPASLRQEAAVLDRVAGRQVRILAGVARKADKGDFAGASRTSSALRVLAGEANTEFLQLGLTECLLRPTGMPL
jgi:hypothetical protein